MAKRNKDGINLNRSKKNYSPSISRSITEPMFAFIRAEKFVLLASLSGIFFFCLMLFMVVQMSQSLRIQKQALEQREKVMHDMSFWQQVTVEWPEYRDGYFMLAVLQYRMGKTMDAQKNVEKALSIDPNFKEGREFEKILSTNN